MERKIAPLGAPIITGERVTVLTPEGWVLKMTVDPQMVWIRFMFPESAFGYASKESRWNLAKAYETEGIRWARGWLVGEELEAFLAAASL